MLRGYPIGYVMLWDSPSDNAGKKTAIGSNQRCIPSPSPCHRRTAETYCPSELPVRRVRARQNFRGRTVKVAYDPIARSFKNADASTEKDSRYVPDVSEAFAANHDNKLSAYRRAFIKRLNEANAKRENPNSTMTARMPSRAGSTHYSGLSAIFCRRWRFPNRLTRRPYRTSSCA